MDVLCTIFHCRNLKCIVFIHSERYWIWASNLLWWRIKLWLLLFEIQWLLRWQSWSCNWWILISKLSLIMFVSVSQWTIQTHINILVFMSFKHSRLTVAIMGFHYATHYLLVSLHPSFPWITKIMLNVHVQSWIQLFLTFFAFSFCLY